jgi:hypothetical protein
MAPGDYREPIESLTIEPPRGPAGPGAARAHARRAGRGRSAAPRAGGPLPDVRAIAEELGLR